ncbi:MAG: hypothetical protein AAGL19_06940 [Pseudomonadota bacterium]
MEKISQQVLYQRLRNRVIELLDMHSCFEDAATLGAFEMVNLVDDSLPLDYTEAPGVFSAKEQEAVDRFLQAYEVAAEATDTDTWSIEWFKSSEDWVRLNEVANQAVAIFTERGRFSEELEEKLNT